MYELQEYMSEKELYFSLSAIALEATLVGIFLNSLPEVTYAVLYVQAVCVHTYT